MVINEFLPNPAGKDTEGEWIELFNNTSGSIVISGWKIKDSSNKTFTFVNQKIGAEEYLVLDYKTTKISLNNDGEALFLYDKQGNLVDRAEYSGSAEAGKSLIRKDNRFVFTDKPTPGKINILEVAVAEKIGGSQNFQTAISADSLKEPAIINRPQLSLGNFLVGIALSLILASLFVIIWKKLDVEKEF